MNVKKLLAMLMAAAVSFTTVPAQAVFAAEEVSNDEDVVLVDDVDGLAIDESYGADMDDDDDPLIDESYGVNKDDDDDDDDDEDSGVNVLKNKLFVGDYSEVEISLSWPDVDVDEDPDFDRAKAVWSVDKPNIAKIIKTDGDKCYIKGIKKGKATITASYEGYGSKSAKINVTEIPKNWIECQQSQKSKYKNTIRVIWGDDAFLGSTEWWSGVSGYALYVNSKKVYETDEENVKKYALNDGDMAYGPFCYYDLKVKNGKKYDIYLKNYSDVTNPVTNKKTRIYGKKTNIEKILYLSDFKVDSIKNNSKNALTVKWSTKSKVSGYQIEYATNMVFDKAKTININSGSTKSKEITGLKKGKTYYVRVRPYKTIGKKKYYGGWLENTTGVKIKK